MDELEKEKIQAEIDKLELEVTKLIAETEKLVADKEWMDRQYDIQRWRLFFYGVSVLVGIVIAIAGIARIMGGLK